MTPSIRRIPKNTVRLRPEQLEDRAVPAVYTVLGTADEAVPGTITSTGPGTFNASSLRAAVIATNLTPEDDTIVLGSGPYTLSVGGPNEDFGATGDLDIKSVSAAGKLTVVGAGSAATVIQAAFPTGQDDRIFDSFGGDLTLQNLQLTGGHAVNDRGGAIRFYYGTLALSSVVVDGNKADYSGGGISFIDYYYYGLSNVRGGLKITNSVISNNQTNTPYGAYYYGGGGVSFYSSNSPFQLTDSVVSGNSVIGGGEGGGLAVFSFGTSGVEINRSVISGNSVQANNNTSAVGGGISVRSYSLGKFNITDSTISGNSVLGASTDNNGDAGRGGGIYIQGTARITGSTISQNIAQGGAATATTGNASGGGGFGGGIFVSGGEGSVSILNSTISGNQAIGGTVTGSGTGTLAAGSAVGGGIYFSNFQQLASLSNSTVVLNQAIAGGATTTGSDTLNSGQALGGGIASESSYGGSLVASSIVALNTLTNAFDPTQVNGVDAYGTFFSLGSNLIGDGTGSTGFTASGDLVGTTAAPINPRIGPLANNGGFTQTHALLDGSPAINAGSNLSGLTTDQRGINYYRVFGGRADIGAFEVQSAYVPYISVGSAGGGPAQLRVLNSDGSVKFADLNPFPGFTGAVYTATADFNGDRIDDIVVGAGVGGGPIVKVFDGATGAEIASFYAFTAFSRGGVSVATGDVNGDGTPDIIVGAGVGGGPRVIAIDGTKLNQTVTINAEQYIADSALLASFFAFDANWRGGITVAFADGQYVLGRGGFSVDLIDGVFVPTGPGIAAEVAIADLTGKVLKVIQVFDNGFIGGVNVAAGGGVIAATPGVGGGPRVQLFDKNGNQFDDFSAFDPSLTGGASVGILGFGTNLSLLVGAGPGGGPQVNVYTLEGEFLNAFPGLDPAFTGGVFVG